MSVMACCNSNVASLSEQCLPNGELRRDLKHRPESLYGNLSEGHLLCGGDLRSIAVDSYLVRRLFTKCGNRALSRTLRKNGNCSFSGAGSTQCLGWLFAEMCPIIPCETS
jgi:hypothetical protein